MRELLYVEKDSELRRNAEKNGVSLRGRHSKDPVLREQYLRGFSCWYYGTPCEGKDEPVDGEAMEEQGNSTAFYAYNFSIGESNTPIELPRSSPPKMPNFQNKSWQPSSASGRSNEAAHNHDNDDISSSRFIAIESLDATLEQLPNSFSDAKSVSKESCP